MRKIFKSSNRERWAVGITNDNSWQKCVTFECERDLVECLDYEKQEFKVWKKYLFSQFDKYEDGWRVIVADPETDEIKYDIYFSGDSEYGGKYPTEYAGCMTWEFAKSIEAFELCRDNKYAIVDMCENK